MTQPTSVIASVPPEEVVNTFLTQIFPNPSIRDYVLTHFSEVLVGHSTIQSSHREKYIHLWTGSGDNGRTIFESLLKQVFGNRAVKLPSSTILDHQTTFTYDLVSYGVDNADLVFIEPSSSERISGPLLKQLNSPDGQICVKQLYHRDDTICVNVHIHLICDAIPNVDPALWNRIHVIPFESTFELLGGGSPLVGRKRTSGGDHTRTFQRDVSLRSKIPGMVGAMKTILYHQYKKNHTPPEPILLETKKYRERNELYDEFCREQLTYSENGKVGWTEVLTQFELWWETVKGRDPREIDPIQEIQNEFCRRYGLLTSKKCFKNLAIRYEEEVELELDSEEKEKQSLDRFSNL